MTDSAHLLDKFGGHELAAGLTIQQKNIGEFKSRLLAYADTHIKPGDLMPVLQIDCAITPAYITQSAVEGLSALEPFGK